MCDGRECEKSLWCEPTWLPVQPWRVDAFCRSCGDKLPRGPTKGTKRTKKTKVVLKLQETPIPQLLVSDERFVEENYQHLDYQATAGYEEDGSGSGAMLQDADFQPPPQHGVVRIYHSTKAKLIDDLRSLRRRKSNGIVSGLLYFFFRDNSDTSLQGHMANFVVGNTRDRPVFLVNEQSKQVVRAVEELEDAEKYVEDVHFLPSPDLPEDIESLSEAAAAFKVKDDPDAKQIGELDPGRVDNSNISGGGGGGNGSAMGSRPFKRVKIEGE